jgi:hypothetical protein
VISDYTFPLRLRVTFAQVYLELPMKRKPYIRIIPSTQLERETTSNAATRVVAE